MFFDPKNGLDTVLDISITDGKILQVAPNIATAKKVVDATGLYVSPGLIDIHTHTYSLLVAHEVPSEGGKTEFADARACYDDLPGPFDGMGKDALEDLVCEHSQLFSRGKIGFTDFTEEERDRFSPVRQVLVRRHPVTGRKSLYLSSHAGGIIGWPVPEARIFLQDLAEHATQRQFVHSHVWRVGDLVIWDNRQVMHRARPFPDAEPRDMRRTTLAGDGLTTAQQ